MAPSALLELAARAGCSTGLDRHLLDCLVRHLVGGEPGLVARSWAQADPPGLERRQVRQGHQVSADPPAWDPTQVDPPTISGAAAAGDSAVAAGAWSRALALGLDGSAGELVIQAGIGCLRISPTAAAWSPVQPRSGVPAPSPVPAPEALQAARLATCRGCSRYDGARCLLAGCGCSGLGNPAALLSRCPLGRWEWPPHQ